MTNDDQVWRFYLKEDKNFIRNGLPEKCLFWRPEESKNPKNKDKVIVQIEDITLDEWKEQINNFLWLVSKVKKVGLIHTDEYGDILLNINFKNKIYCKGVFVTKSESDICYGYNIDLKLDRDRNCIPNFDEFKEKGNNIIWYLIENFKEESRKQKQSLDNEEVRMFNEFPNQIIQFLEKNLPFLKFNYKYSSCHVSTKAADFLWKLNAELRRNKDERFAGDELKKYPQPLSYVTNLNKFLKERNLNEDFYNYFMTSSLFMDVLDRSTYYESYNRRFENLLKSSTIIPSNELEIKINNVVCRIQKLESSFSRNKIEFKKFENEKTYNRFNGIFYFSSLLFDKGKQMENFIFGKCLDMLGIKIIDLLDKFEIVSKDK